MLHTAMLHVICLLLYTYTSAFQTTISWHEPHKKASIFFTIPVPHDDMLYKEYIDFSTDHDAVTITHWTAQDDPTTMYDPVFKETKKVYTKDTTFKLDLSFHEPVDKPVVRVAYYLKSKGMIDEALIDIPMVLPTYEQSAIIEQAIDVPENILLEEKTSDATHISQEPSESWSCSISHLIEHTRAPWLQCLLILLLGTLLSLTPCIYPMIPITIGILQGQGTTSVWRNFIVSSCYTVGVAMTFATLGITAAYTGKLFGSFMHHPITISLIVLLLLYLAGSMLGLYEMYTPKILSAKNHSVQGGSYIAAFLFGAISGTVASPCVSPGLALVLSIVTKLANPLLGFIFLFSFGVGLSLPLLIIGTFSSSLSILPRAGIWMVEIKKIFGFLLLGMSLYFLSIILPLFISTWMLALLLAGTGIYYLYNRQKSPFMRILYNLLGIILVASSILVSYIAIKATIHPEDCSIIGVWTQDYACAHNQALHEHKLLLLKVEAACCTLCKAIDKKFFKQTDVITILDKKYVPVLVDGGDDTNPITAELVKKFNIIGFPTILIIQPNTEHIIKKWGSELYNYTVEEFIQELQTIS